MQQHNAALRAVWRRRQREHAFATLVAAIIALIGIDILAGVIRTASHSDPIMAVTTVVVEPGDTLWDIWKRETGGRVNWGSWRERVIQMNSIEKYLQPGDRLDVPTVVGYGKEPTDERRDGNIARAR